MQSGIYKITSPSSRIYIGQSINLNKRINDYKIYKKSGFQTRLKASFKKYGVDKHIFEIVEICELLYLNDRERYWQEYYNVLSPQGLNCKYTATLDKSGVLSTESKLKISKSLTGLTRTDEQKKKMSDSQKGKKQSKDTIAKRVSKLKEYLKDKNYREKFGKSLKKKVYQYDKEYNLIAEYDSVTKAVNILGVNKASITKTIKGNENKTCKGFYWTYKKHNKLV